MKTQFKELEIEFTRAIENITDIVIKKEINDHAKLYIKGTVPDNEREKSAIEMSVMDKLVM